MKYSEEEYKLLEKELAYCIENRDFWPKLGFSTQKKVEARISEIEAILAEAGRIPLKKKD